MAKRLSVVDEAEEGHRVSLEGKQMAEIYKRFAMLADDLCADAQDARTVAAVATEAWSEEHESGVGVLALLIHKLDCIERAGRAILEHLPKGYSPKRSQARRV